MNELIKYQQELEILNLEELMDQLVFEAKGSYGVTESYKEKSKTKVTFIKMEIVNRFNEK